MENVIEVEHLRKVYGSLAAVEDVSFSVRKGEIFGLLGPNGAGKTTSVECLQGLRHADGGNLKVLGLNPATEACFRTPGWAMAGISNIRLLWQPSRWWPPSWPCASSAGSRLVYSG